MVTTDSKIDQFAKQFTEAHLELAKLAAFPVGITVDMLYQLWYNFKDRIEGLPMLAVSDVLLSPLFRPIGNGIFEMEKETRTQMLDKIHSDTEGGRKLYELAIFTQLYAQKRLVGERYASFKETLLMNADATLDPIKTLQALIQRLQTSQKDNNRSEILRLRELIELFAIQEKGRAETPNSTFYPLLQYSIALKGAYINAPTAQIQKKFEGLKGVNINLLKEKTVDAQMIQLPASLVGKGILQKLNIQQEEKKKRKQQILALIIGINDYQHPIPKLQGAINDGEIIDKWLNQNFGTPQSGTDLKTVKLFNQQATKEVILEAFRHHAAIAQAGDFVFFSFSGFGLEMGNIQEDKIKELDKSHNEVKNRVQEFISQKKLQQAINELPSWESIDDNKIKNKIILTYSQYNYFEQSKKRAILAEIEIVRKDIVNSILEILELIKDYKIKIILKEQSENSVMLPYNYISENGENNHILGSEILESVKQYPRVNFIFFLDGCYFYCFFPEITNNMVALSSYSKNEEGIEKVFQGKQQGVFTYYANKVLKENKRLTYTQLIQKTNKYIRNDESVKLQTSIIQCIEQNRHKTIFKDKLGKEVINKDKDEVLRRIEQNRKEKSPVLDLTGLNLSNIPNEVYELTHLKTLELFDNNIKVIPNDINQLTKLSYIFASKNLLSELSDSLIDLKQLKGVQIDDNQFEIYPAVLNSIESLQYISLKGNHITVLPNEISRLPDLTILDIRNNPVMNISRQKLKFVKKEIQEIFIDIESPVKNDIPVMIILANDEASNIIKISLKSVVESKQLQIIRISGEPMEWYKQIKPYERNIALLHIMFLGGKGDYEQYFTNDNLDKDKLNIQKFLLFLGKPDHLRLCFLSFNNSKQYEKVVLDYGFDFCISTPNTNLDKYANEFIGRFYNELAQGRTIEEAYHKLLEKQRIKSNFSKESNALSNSFNEGVMMANILSKFE